MAAPIKKCVVCFKIISDRSYRSLSSDTSKEQYRDVFKLLGLPDLNGFACNVCCNKLNRIQKLTIDLKTKVISIKEEREKLISTVRGMIGIQTLEKENNPVSTPKGTKRPFNVIKLTPTPKSKVKKGLFASPSAEKVVNPLNCHAVLKSKTVQSDDKSTQTKDRSEEFDVKVNNLYIFNVINLYMCRGVGAKNTIFVILRARVKICFTIFIGCCEV